MATSMSPTQSLLLWRQERKSNSWKWKLVWLSQLPPTALSVMSSFIWNQEFGSHHFKHKICEFFATSGFHQTENYVTIAAATLLLATPRASFCTHHLVQVFTHKLNPRGLHKCINIAQTSSALHMQNTCIVPRPNTLLSHKIVLSAGRIWQMNLLTIMKQYLMNCGWYTQSSVKNLREASVYWKSKGNVNTSETCTANSLIQLSRFWRKEQRRDNNWGL